MLCQHCSACVSLLTCMIHHMYLIDDGDEDDLEDNVCDAADDDDVTL